jgi:hypothetical protein
VRLQDWEHLLGSLSHLLRHRVPEPGHSAAESHLTNMIDIAMIAEFVLDGVVR